MKPLVRRVVLVVALGVVLGAASPPAWAGKPQPPAPQPDPAIVFRDIVNGANPAYYLRVMNADGTNIRAVLGPEGNPVFWQPSWSPDAQWIVFAATYAAFPASHPELNAIGPGIYMIDLAATTLCQVTPLRNGKPVDAGPAWSPGPVPGWGPAKIVYSDDSDVPGDRDLYFVDPTCGAAPVNVTRTADMLEYSATWGPGQTRLAAPASGPTGDSLLVFDVQAPLLSLAMDLGVPAGMGYAPRYPDWSPDGHAIAFSDVTFFPSDLWLYSFELPGFVRLTDTAEVNEHWPAWAPDSARIVFATFGGVSQIYVMDAQPGALRRPLTSGRKNRYQEPDWRAF